MENNPDLRHNTDPTFRDLLQVVACLWVAVFWFWFSPAQLVAQPEPSGSAVNGALLAAQTADSTTAKSSAVSWRSQRSALEHRFGEDLVKIAQWCRENGLPQQVEQTYKLKIPRDPNRQYIFLPTEKTMPELPEGVLGQWLEKINQAKRDHASRILKLAEQAAEAEQGAIAYQLLHEVIYYDRDHERVRGILGHKLKDGRWRFASDAISVRPATRTQPQFQWPAGSYLRVRTPHFEIDSVASEARTRYLAERLENWYLVWRQVFFEFWSRSSVIARWMNGQSSDRPLLAGRSRFHVVFFPDKASYVAALQPRVPNIAQSYGYYSNTEEVSFFFDGSSLEEATWRHELTHQLFREAPGAKPNALETHSFWIDEGVATYFESLCELEGFATLGGFDASRLQHARLRFFLEKYYVPIGELADISRDNFQQRADTSLLYSQCAAFFSMLMNDQEGADQQATVKLLQVAYKGRLKSDSIETFFDRPFASFDQQYADFLVTDSNTVAKFLYLPKQRTELSLYSAQLEQAAFDSIGDCTSLRWLDLSANPIRKQSLASLSNCQSISQLFLVRGRLSADALEPLEKLTSLQELVLSGSDVQDQHLARLRSGGQLKLIRLASTNVTDNGLKSLAGIASLQLVDVTNTNVTDQGVLEFRQARPNVMVQR